MSDDIKKAAEHCLAAKSCEDCLASEKMFAAGCATSFARAYLALREQVETVALPALKAASDHLNDGSALPEDEAKRNAILAYSDQLDAAIKAIEEGRA